MELLYAWQFLKQHRYLTIFVTTVGVSSSNNKKDTSWINLEEFVMEKKASGSSIHDIKIKIQAVAMSTPSMIAAWKIAFAVMPTLQTDHIDYCTLFNIEGGIMSMTYKGVDGSIDVLAVLVTNQNEQKKHYAMLVNHIMHVLPKKYK
jgi:hypothetical protein